MSLKVPVSIIFFKFMLQLYLLVISIGHSRPLWWCRVPMGQNQSINKNVTGLSHLITSLNWKCIETWNLHNCRLQHGKHYNVWMTVDAIAIFRWHPLTPSFVVGRIDELSKSNLVNGEPKTAFHEEFMVNWQYLRLLATLKLFILTQWKI